MAKFIYKMQNILNIKEKLEEQAKTAYGMAKAKLNEEEARLLVLEKRKSVYEDRLRGKISSVLNILEIRQCEEAVETIKVSIKFQLIAIKRAEMELEAARVKLNEAMVERKIQEKLKENAFEEFKAELGAEEKKEVDELVSFKYNKSTGSEGDE